MFCAPCVTAMKLTIDTSAALKLVIDEPGMRTARSYLPEKRNGVYFIKNEIRAPILLALEAHNTLAKQFRRERLGPDVFFEMHPTLNYYITFDDLSASLAERARIISLIANSWSHRATTPITLTRNPFNIYDCVFIAHAEHFGSTLLTADERQAEIADKGFGIPVAFIGKSDP